ncbi:hypothetical protein Glove_16g42 [Diversispora epigaea]|uniref:RING-type domain-containing protein n=1 Tax=Diversispora epigaea TaxID=1348612 RepID=A0A397JR37_9GLOM|nr:hypothetical protein Glove_16g42 [Diversispora epigaea]
MASETLLSSSEKRTDTANISQLKALSLNFLQNISEISNEEEVPKLSPCHKCGKEILAFPLRAFVVLSCEHIFHRTCIEQHIVRIDTQASTHPSCPICSTIIEVIREEGTLASDKYQMVPKIRSLIVSEKKTFQQSPDTVDNDDDDDGDLEEMIKLGLIVDDSSEKTKQVIIEDHETSPIASEIISDNQNDEASTAEKGTTNVVQINSADQNNANKTAVLPSKRAISFEEGTSSKNPPAKKQKSGKKGESSTVKKLIEELTVEITPSTNISLPPPSQATTSDSIDFTHLYQEIINAESLNDSASQNMIRSYYNFGKGLVDRLNHYKKSNRERASLILVNNEVREQLPEDITDNTLYKKRERARKIYELFDNIGVSRISYVKSFSAITISKLSWDEIDYIIIACTAPRSRDLTS